MLAMKNFEELQEFIRKNPNWKTLLKQPPYNLKSVVDCPWDGHENWTLLMYNLFDSDLKNAIVRQCRGTIVDDKGNIICAPYIKFFNYGDSNCPKLDKELIINEKMDGQLVKSFKVDGQMFWVSNGGWDVNALGEDGSLAFKKAEALADSKDDTWRERIPDGYTLMFELCSSDNKIICEYGEPELWIHGVRNNEGDELDIYEFVEELHLPFKVPVKLPFNTIDEAIKTINTWDGKLHEGIVVRDRHFNRVKIKCDDYLRIKFAKGISTPKKLYNTWTDGEWDDLAKTPEILNKILEFDKHIKDLSSKVVDVFYLAKQLSNECSSRKEFYFKVKDLYDSAKIEKWHVSLILGVKDKTLNEFIENFKYHHLSNSWKHYKIWNDRLSERPSIIILVGISGCGKTTWCKNYISEATILSMDTIRKEVFNNVSDQSHNKDVARIFNKQLEDEIALKHNIVIDNMNINIRYIDDIVNKSKGYDIIFYLFDNSLDWQKCFNRVKNDNTDKYRTDNVFVSGKPLIQVMSEKYEIVRKEIFQKYKNTAEIIICN